MLADNFSNSLIELSRCFKFYKPKELCPNCSFLKEKIELDNQYTNAVTQLHTNPFDNFISANNYTLLSTKNEWFCSDNVYFCENCHSKVFENIYHHTDNHSSDPLKTHYTASYAFSSFDTLSISDFREIYLKIVLNEFERSYKQHLSSKPVYLYNITDFNYGIGIDKSTDYHQSIKKFVENPCVDQMYLDFSEVPISTLSKEACSYRSVSRFQVIENDLHFLNKAALTHLDKQEIDFSIFVDKQDIMSLEFFDFMTEEWVNNFDEEKINYLIQHNKEYFSKSPILTHSPYTLNYLLLREIESSTSES